LKSIDYMSRLLPYIPQQHGLTPQNKLATLVENRKVFTLEKCELNIYETYQAAESVPLKFNDLVITSMLRGKKRMHARDNNLFDYVPGESLLWQANEWMVIDFPEATEKNPTQCVALTIDPNEIHETLQFLNRRLPKADESGEWKLDMEEFYLLNSVDFTNAIDKIIRVSVDNSRMKDVFAELALRELLLKLMQTQARQLVEKHYKQMSASHRFAAVIQYIKENIHQKILVDDLCKKVYMSRPSFFRIFKREFGITPVDYILKEKIQLAKKLLDKPDMSVSSACYESGFNSINHFIRIFREFENCTPLKYKQRQKELIK
jgi:AraC-like DNA-binding protein